MLVDADRDGNIIIFHEGGHTIMATVLHEFKDNIGKPFVEWMSWNSDIYCIPGSSEHLPNPGKEFIVRQMFVQPNSIQAVIDKLQEMKEKLEEAIVRYYQSDTDQCEGTGEPGDHQDWQSLQDEGVWEPQD